MSTTGVGGPPLQADWPERPAGTPPPRRRRLAGFKELPVLIVLAFGLALLIKTFAVQAFYIPSGSMEPGLVRGDRVLVNKMTFRFREPRRGEIVVFVAERDKRPRSFLEKAKGFFTEGLGAALPPERDYIKRVIALPGETILYRDSRITITKTDGTKLTLSEPYARTDDRPYGPFSVPEGHYFMMGDNRDSSEDSRFIGPIARRDLIGPAFVRLWPPGRLRGFGAPSYGEPEVGGGAGRWIAGGIAVAAIAAAVVGLRRRSRRLRAAGGGADI